MSTSRVWKWGIVSQKATLKAAFSLKILCLGCALLLGSCRREEPPAPLPPVVVVAPPPVPSAPPEDVVLSVTLVDLDAGGRAQTLVLPASDFAQIGDLLRVTGHAEGDATLIASALVTVSDAHGITARVIALGRRTRPVQVGDHCAVMPVPTAPEALVQKAQEASPTAVADPAHGSQPQPHITTQEPPRAAVMTTSGHQVAAHVAAPSYASEAELPDGERGGDVRARLTAERSYFLLAAEVLRLPADDPRVQVLQTRIRAEHAALLGGAATEAVPQSPSTPAPAKHHHQEKQP